MNNNYIKNNEKIKAIQSEMDYEKRLCDIYGLCSNNMSNSCSHDVTHFGLNKLSEMKILSL